MTRIEVTRTEQIHIRVSPGQKQSVRAMARQSSSRSVSDFILSCIFPKKSLTSGRNANAIDPEALKSRISGLHADFFSIRSLLEDELGIDLSRSSSEIDPGRDPVAFAFTRQVERIQSLYDQLELISSEYSEHSER